MKHLPQGGILSACLFDKEISNYIVPIQTSQAFNNNLFLNANLAQPLRVFTYGSRGSSHARELEFNWSQRFHNLPAD